MRKHLLFILLLIPLPVWAQTGPTITLSSQYTNYPTGSNITLTAKTSVNVPEVSFYNGSTLLATLSTCTGNPCVNYTYVWDDVPQSPQGGYHVYAVIGTVNTSAVTSNGPIDMVTDPPAGTFSTFGENQSGNWAPGDNQFCSTTWPYNGRSSAFDDGTCEWTGTTTAPNSQSISSYTPTNSTPPASTKDSLDDTMHSLSDFDTFAENILGQNLTQLSTNLNNWYPQAAMWIAPACTSTNPNTPVGCNPGQPGVLYNVFDQNILGQWLGVMNNWLSNNYIPTASPYPWCLPSATDPSMSALNANNKTVPTQEYEYITQNNASTTVCPGKCDGGVCSDGVTKCSVWGDLPHVVSCLNYNAGPTQTQYTNSSYATCLATLNGMYSNPAGDSCPTSTTCSSENSSCWPTECQAAATTYLSNSNTFSWNGTDCNALLNGSFANWVSNQVNYGPVYNYQLCLQAMSTVSCSTNASLPAACEPNMLGRSLLNPKTEPEPSPSTWNCSTSVKNTSCQNGSACILTPNGAQGGIGQGFCAVGNNIGCQETFEQWAQDSLTLAQNEAPKYALRYAYLNDIYTRAKTMQSIFNQGNTALTNFFCKGSNCPVVGKIPVVVNNVVQLNQYKTYTGGPAQQLMDARSEPSVTELLPNSVIYGWRDKTLANGQVLTSGSGAGYGYAHVVKVTAYGPGRDGKLTGSVADFINSSLPWVSTSSTWDTRTYNLEQRDGYVYVSVKRWDENQNTPVLFPNQHALWNFSYNNPNANTTTANASSLDRDCFVGYGNGPTVNNSQFSPIGITLSTQQGLANYMKAASGDQAQIQHAFMLNDDIGGNVDVNNGTSNYAACLADADSLLNQGVESHACARYIASSNASGGSSGGDADYSIKFVNCGTADNNNPPDDLLPQ